MGLNGMSAVRIWYRVYALQCEHNQNQQSDQLTPRGMFSPVISRHLPSDLVHLSSERVTETVQSPNAGLNAIAASDSIPASLPITTVKRDIRTGTKNKRRRRKGKEKKKERKITSTTTLARKKKKKKAQRERKKKKKKKKKASKMYSSIQNDTQETLADN